METVNGQGELAVPRRITGTELEFGAAVQRLRETEFEPIDWSNEKFLRSVPDEYSGLGQFLRNGSRLYIDYGSHPEYATPEDDSIIGTAANEIAGERIVYTAMEAMIRHGGYAGFALNRRVIDHAGNSWGYHENYSCRRDTYHDPAFIPLLGGHIATRNIFAGAGTLTYNGGFAIAQKAQILGTGESPSTTEYAKPLFNTRDEPHADSSRFARVHVVSGDPTMSPWATRMKLGTTSLMLDVIDQPRLRRSLAHLRVWPGWLHRVARTVALDPMLRRTVELQDGSTVRPLDIQIQFMDAAKELASEVDIGPEKSEILSEWERALVDLEEDPFKLVDRADWPMRLHVLQRHREKHDLRQGAPELAAVDYQFDALHPKGIGMLLRETLWAPWMPEEALIEERMTAPSQTTRAATRSRFIGHALSSPNPRAYKADWGNLRGPDGCFLIMDPFSASNQRVDRLLKTREQYE